VRAFDQVIANGGLGDDKAFLYDTSGTDHFQGTWAESRMWGSGYTIRARAFERVYAYASQGTDDATLTGVAGDVRENGSNWAEIHDPARTRWIRAIGFDTVGVTIPSSSSTAKKAKGALLPVDLLLASGGQW
jgi:hypothetical protein